MASEVTICNTALGYLGDTAEIASLNEASTQAQLCKKFYAPARDALLEMAAWGFATTRAALAEIDGSWQKQWQHAYAMPNNVMNVLAVLPSDAPGDTEVNISSWPGVNGPVGASWPLGYAPVPGAIVYTPQPYTIELGPDGTEIILTNQESALLRYTMSVTNTTLFSPLFTLALGRLLASMLAGPILKGDAGAAEATRQYKIFQVIEAQAEASDANQVYTKTEASVSWIAGR